jgi:hypothetical protein
VDLMLYAVMLVVLSIVAHRFPPHGVVTILPVGVVGGLFSALLGVLGMLGYPMRRWAIRAMTVLSVLLLAQAVGTWQVIKESGEGMKPASLIPTLLWLFAVGQLVNLLQNRSSVLFGSDEGDRDATARKDRR